MHRRQCILTQLPILCTLLCHFVVVDVGAVAAAVAFLYFTLLSLSVICMFCVRVRGPCTMRIKTGKCHAIALSESLHTSLHVLYSSSSRRCWFDYTKLYDAFSAHHVLSTVFVVRPIEWNKAQTIQRQQQQRKKSEQQIDSINNNGEKITMQYEEGQRMLEIVYDLLVKPSFAEQLNVQCSAVMNICTHTQNNTSYLLGLCGYFRFRCSCFAYKYAKNTRAHV